MPDAGGAAMLARLSQDALLTAAACAPQSDSRATAELLYHANWYPMSPVWLDRLLGGTVAEPACTGPWLRSRDDGWVHWNRRRVAGDGPYKVYVSVVPDRAEEALCRAAPVLAQHLVPACKHSAPGRGYLRPDRLVAYCDRAAAAQALADDLAEAVSSLPPQGVPFTASARGTNGAISTARDPEPRVAAFGPSWRRWVTRKLAGHLHASDEPTARGRVDAALAALERDGVQTATWSPAPLLWAPTADRYTDG